MDERNEPERRAIQTTAVSRLALYHERCNDVCSIVTLSKSLYKVPYANDRAFSLYRVG